MSKGNSPYSFLLSYIWGILSITSGYSLAGALWSVNLSMQKQWKHTLSGECNRKTMKTYSEAVNLSIYGLVNKSCGDTLKRWFADAKTMKSWLYSLQTSSTFNFGSQFRSMFRTLQNMQDGGVCKNSERFLVFDYFYKKLTLRCLARFWFCLWNQ